MAPSSSTPPFAPFPSQKWAQLLQLEDWAACIVAWVALAEHHLGLPDADFDRVSLKDESLSSFLVSFITETSSPGSIFLPGGTHSVEKLLKPTFLLAARCLRSLSPPVPLLTWQFLSSVTSIYGRPRASALLARLSPASTTALGISLSALKKYLTTTLDAGIATNLPELQSRLDSFNGFLSVYPPAAELFLAGSDFLDGLVSCFRITNPPLRKVLIATTYLCLHGLTEGDAPRWGVLTDVLYALKAAADAHKAGPTGVEDSLVAELVTATPVITVLEKKLETAGKLGGRQKSVLSGLATFKKPGGGMKPRLTKKKVDKGKGRDEDGNLEMHMHRMSQVTQIQDLFPELGSAFVSKLLDEYAEDTEQVISHLLEGTLPPHLDSADRSEQLAPVSSQPQHQDHAESVPEATQSALNFPTRRNVFDNDEIDALALNTSQLNFGKQTSSSTADTLLEDRSTAPTKAAILAALEAFDSDDDERDDTYDAADVGGTVDTTEEATETNEEVLFRAWQANPGAFARDAATRRGEPRARIRLETGMTDEAIEGWAVMLARNPGQKRRLEVKLSMKPLVQNELASTSWKASPAGSGAEDSDSGTGFRGRGRGRGPRGDRGRGRGRGNVTGPSGDRETQLARRRKEENKGSRVRDQRARKMGRAGFPG